MIICSFAAMIFCNLFSKETYWACQMSELYIARAFATKRHETHGAACHTTAPDTLLR